MDICTVQYVLYRGEGEGGGGGRLRLGSKVVDLLNIFLR